MIFLRYQKRIKRIFRWEVIILVILSFLCLDAAYSQMIIHSLPSPGPEPRGLAWDGYFLWCAEYSSGKIFKLDPSDGVKVDSFSFPLHEDFGGITWGSEDQIWVADGSLIFEIEPASGDTLSYFSCPGG